ncbi:hypothetical protein LO772_07650 [Yinghuangia sp. ASG 101]|uniref:hypothetical protein n=1 Tax=Yinghuangia sp. ASG 101 TaxID=2896848 RepID=UPI001E38D027|nr:hypothetical protein [Yinghuangia sp. ASG 101]UGQ13473.1 hypothetical protein LO772_07650 [Yinghuangia sp. ASG 101]
MNRPLLSPRAALVFLLAGLTGAGAAVLTAMAGSGGPQALLCGGGALGLAVGFFDRIIGVGHEAAGLGEGSAEAAPTRPASAGE